MKARNSDRDRLKLLNWEEYVQKTDRSLPLDVKNSGAVDELVVFENTDADAVAASLEKVLRALGR